MSLFKTELKDYTLWFDGVIEVDPQVVEGLILKDVDPTKIAVTHVTPDIVKYNRLAPDKITTKEEIDADKVSFDWKLPKEYLDIDIVEYVLKKFEAKQTKMAPMEGSKRVNRVHTELIEFTSRGLLDVLKVLIYVVDTFKKNNIVWGVGRGSSCASYVLYLLEVHSVDPIKYEIPLEEFFK